MSGFKIFRFGSKLTIHSFIHYGDLYSAPSRLLFRSAPDPCTTKKKSFETRVECVRKNPGEQPIPTLSSYTTHSNARGKALSKASCCANTYTSNVKRVYIHIHIY